MKIKNGMHICGLVVLKKDKKISLDDQRINEIFKCRQ